jgi:uncharacterized membrane protein (TIGR02234 family)
VLALLLLSGLVALTTLPTWVTATAAAERAAADATGVSGVVGEVAVGPWPLVAAGLGVVVVAAAVRLALVSGRWPAASDRHERAGGSAPPAAAGADDERSTWDALSRGDDPT